MNAHYSRRKQATAFTLVELLVVIAIISVIAGLVVGVAGSSSQKKTRLQTLAEMQKIQAALEVYKQKVGTYPQAPRRIPIVNPLFYELTGVKYTNASGTHVYTSMQAPNHLLTSAQVNSYFGLPGFANFVDETAGNNMEILLPLTPKQYGQLNGSGPYLLKVPAKVPKVTATNVHGFNNLWKTNTENYWQYRAYDPNGYNPQGYDLWAELPGRDAQSVEVVSSWGNNQ